MFKTSNKYLLLFIILAFAFAYRMLLMHWATYPPGADIGLHESIIHSITASGNTNFLWNDYQMGGGLSLTFPGYHIFVSHIILMTGLPDYLAHSLVVSFFSSFIVLCAFLITRKVWRESTAFIVAFLVAISRFDIEMLLWGGYPNVIPLMLIPLIFYLYLERDKFSLAPFIATTTILSGTIFLTHSLSAVMFVGITFSTVILAAIFSKKARVSKKRLLIWLLPLFLGAALVSPFLAEAAPAYLGANVETFTGGVADIRLALLSTRVLPVEWVIPLFACVIFFFLFSKKYRGNFFTVPAFLLTLWVLVPMLFTQGFLVGLYTDYNRFLYYVILPVIILIALGIDHGAGFFARIIDTYLSFTKKMPRTITNTTKPRSRVRTHLTCKNIYFGFVLGFLLLSFLTIPIFLTPFQGTTIQSFYQTMTDPGYEAMQWARQNTPVGSIFVSDALYGWWFSGFAERPTLSAVDPQYLTLAREFEPAKVAKSLLDTDYMIDNGLIQVREDGGYIGRHNPMFLGKLNWTYFPYPFFNFNNGDTMISISDGPDVRFFSLNQLAVQEMKLENDSTQARISVKKGNSLFNFTQVLTVYECRKFVNMSIAMESMAEEVSLLSFHSILHIRGSMINKTDTVGLFEEGSKVLGQIIYAENHPEEVKLITPENPSGLEFVYNLHSESSAEIQLFVSAFSVSDDPDLYDNTEIWENPHLNKVMDDNLKGYLSPEEEENGDLALNVFDYRKAVNDWSISYIAVRDSTLLPKFAKDPAFSLVFINDEVAIFHVRSSFNQEGRTP
jgi:hypothetical protein